MKYYAPKNPGDAGIWILDPDREVCILIDKDPVGKTIYDFFSPKKKLNAIGIENSCCLCDSKRIQSRFEILDL